MRRSSSDRRASAVARDPATREARRRARPPAALRLEPLTIEPPQTVARATERQKPRNRAVYAPAALASRIESGWQTRRHKSRPGEPFGAQGEGTRAWPTSCRLLQLTPAAVANGLCEQIRKQPHHFTLLLDRELDKLRRRQQLIHGLAKRNNAPAPSLPLCHPPPLLGAQPANALRRAAWGPDVQSRIYKGPFGAVWGHRRSRLVAGFTTNKGPSATALGTRATTSTGPMRKMTPRRHSRPRERSAHCHSTVTQPSQHEQGGRAPRDDIRPMRVATDSVALRHFGSSLAGPSLSFAARENAITRSRCFSLPQTKRCRGTRRTVRPVAAATTLLKRAVWSSQRRRNRLIRDATQRLKGAAGCVASTRRRSLASVVGPKRSGSRIAPKSRTDAPRSRRRCELTHGQEGSPR